MDNLFPSQQAYESLKRERIAILTALPFVQQVLCFGSLARGTADRWSDIDLIAVTETRRQFADVVHSVENEHVTIWFTGCREFVGQL